MRARCTNKVFMLTEARDWAALVKVTAAANETIVSNATIMKDGLHGREGEDVDDGDASETIGDEGTGGVYMDIRYEIATIIAAVAVNSRAARQ